MTEQKTDIVTREMRRQELGDTKFASNQQGGALMQPTNGKELMDMANMMSASGSMVRDFYRGNAGDCAALIMICQPYGFNPFMVSWKTYKASKSADAPVSFEGQLVNAMVNQSAPVRGRLKYSYDGEGTSRSCTVTGIDRETGDEITYTSPEIANIPTKNSPLWKADPDQQLGYYSARSWARRHFPELLLGVYTREEIEEAPPRDITPKEPGGFAKKAMAAREAEISTPRTEPEVADPHADVPDAEIADAPDKQDVDAPHWTEAIEVGDAFPGSSEFDEGAKAFRAGMKREMCSPDYEFDIPRAADWLGGWDQAEKAAS